MSEQRTSDGFRNFTTNSPIKACRLGRDDLRRLYSIINEKQVEYGKMVAANLIQQPNETPEQFQERRTRVERAFVTVVSVTGGNGEVVTGWGDEFLGSINVPDRIVKVFYSTITGPSGKNQTIATVAAPAEIASLRSQ